MLIRDRNVIDSEGWPDPRVVHRMLNQGVAELIGLDDAAAVWRKLYFGDDRPISPPPHHIQVADTRYGLDVIDPDRIELLRLGWQKDALI